MGIFALNSWLLTDAIIDEQLRNSNDLLIFYLTYPNGYHDTVKEVCNIFAYGETSEINFCGVLSPRMLVKLLMLFDRHGVSKSLRRQHLPKTININKVSHDY